jgi:putative heme transporter
MPARIRSRDVWIVLANALALVALVSLVWQLRTLVTWLLVAVVIALAVEPLIQVFVRRGVHRGWAVLISCLGLAGALAGMIATVIPMVAAQSAALVERVPELLQRLQDSAAVSWLDARVDLIDRVRAEAEERASQAAGPAVGVATAIVGALIAAVTIAVLSVLVMLVGGDVARGAYGWLRPDRRVRWQRIGERMKHVVGRFVLGELIVALIAGVVMGVTTAILGVPYFLALALIMVLLTLIPFIGSMIGAVLVVGVTFTSEGLVPGLIALGVYLVYQQLENQVVQPIVQRRTMHINALLVALALLAGTMLAGIAGALLALPVVGALQVILDDVHARRAARWGEVPPPRVEAHGPTRTRTGGDGEGEGEGEGETARAGELQPAPTA